MSSFYDSNAPKKATNLTVNSDLLKQAKQLNINISSVLETALLKIVKQLKKEEWLSENKEAIKVYNEQVSQFGLFGDEMRTF